jgi:hypothetical protein
MQVSESFIRTIEKMTSKRPSHISITDSGWERKGEEKCQRKSFWSIWRFWNQAKAVWEDSFE